jgi:hypothetical protein
LTTVSRAMVCLPGQMEDDMRGAGSTESSMASESTTQQKATPKRANGAKANVSDGSQRSHLIMVVGQPPKGQPTALLTSDSCIENFS